MNEPVPNIGDVAARIGVTTGELQKLRHAAGLAGVGTDALATAMERFSRRLAEAVAGNGDLAEFFERNDIALRSRDGALRSPIDILGDYAELIKNAGSGQERLLLGFKLLDAEGAAFVNVLKNGRAGLGM